MATYRCYFFDVRNGILGVEPADWPDDRTAIIWGAAQLTRGVAVAVEIWQLDRRICRLEKPRHSGHDGIADLGNSA